MSAQTSRLEAEIERISLAYRYHPRTVFAGGEPGEAHMETLLEGHVEDDSLGDSYLMIENEAVWHTVWMEIAAASGPDFDPVRPSVDFEKDIVIAALARCDDALDLTLRIVSHESDDDGGALTVFTRKILSHVGSGPTRPGRVAFHIVKIPRHPTPLNHVEVRENVTIRYPETPSPDGVSVIGGEAL